MYTAHGMGDAQNPGSPGKIVVSWYGVGGNADPARGRGENERQTAPGIGGTRGTQDSYHREIWGP